MKAVIICFLLVLTSTTSYAFSIENSRIRLMCPKRGQIEVILHHYKHTQELWGEGQFETGGGHWRKGPLLMIPFANLDMMIYNQTTGTYSYWYASNHHMVRCRLVKITSTYPSDIPYYRE
ncbi:hypothetical protein S726_004087 [Salmonella enterica subsp. enterica]|nr:hypothetical protein [Salmonella enterica subsp. enterica]